MLLWYFQKTSTNVYMLCHGSWNILKYPPVYGCALDFRTWKMDLYSIVQKFLLETFCRQLRCYTNTVWHGGNMQQNTNGTDLIIRTHPVSIGISIMQDLLHVLRIAMCRLKGIGYSIVEINYLIFVSSPQWDIRFQCDGIFFKFWNGTQVAKIFFPMTRTFLWWRHNIVKLRWFSHLLCNTMMSYTVQCFSLAAQRWELKYCLHAKRKNLYSFFRTQQSSRFKKALVMCWGWFNVKMSSYQYRKSHCGDKTIWRPSYLHNGISYAGKDGIFILNQSPDEKPDILDVWHFPPTSHY